MFWSFSEVVLEKEAPVKAVIFVVSWQSQADMGTGAHGKTFSVLLQYPRLRKFNLSK